MLAAVATANRTSGAARVSPPATPTAPAPAPATVAVEASATAGANGAWPARPTFPKIPLWIPPSTAADGIDLARPLPIWLASLAGSTMRYRVSVDSPDAAGGSEADDRFTRSARWLANGLAALRSRPPSTLEPIGSGW